MGWIAESDSGRGPGAHPGEKAMPGRWRARPPGLAQITTAILARSTLAVAVARCMP